MRAHHKLYVEESGKGTWGGFPSGRALPQCLWDVQVGQAGCLQIKGPSSVLQ